MYSPSAGTVNSRSESKPRAPPIRRPGVILNGKGLVPFLEHQGARIDQLRLLPRADVGPPDIGLLRRGIGFEIGMRLPLLDPLKPSDALRAEFSLDKHIFDRKILRLLRIGRQ